MKTAAIIGGGAFGTAMACAARRADLEVRLWAREPEVVASINAGNGNPLFLADTALEPGIVATCHLTEVIEATDFLLLAVLTWCCSRMSMASTSTGAHPRPG
jgi:glycerol-3-phosphate dehydrogenase (NAD(P)+)